LCGQPYSVGRYQPQILHLLLCFFIATENNFQFLGCFQQIKFSLAQKQRSWRRIEQLILSHEEVTGGSTSEFKESM
jgi:hypothetical protein